MSDKEFEKIKELAKKCVDESETGKDAFFIFCNKVSNKKLTKDTLEKVKEEIDEQTEMHADGEFYIKNIDVKRIIDKHLKEVENNG